MWGYDQNLIYAPLQKREESQCIRVRVWRVLVMWQIWSTSNLRVYFRSSWLRNCIICDTQFERCQGIQKCRWIQGKPRREFLDNCWGRHGQKTDSVRAAMLVAHIGITELSFLNWITGLQYTSVRSMFTPARFIRVRVKFAVFITAVNSLALVSLPEYLTYIMAPQMSLAIWTALQRTKLRIFT